MKWSLKNHENMRFPIRCKKKPKSDDSAHQSNECRSERICDSEVEGGELTIKKGETVNQEYSNFETIGEVKW